MSSTYVPFFRRFTDEKGREIEEVRALYSAVKAQQDALAHEADHAARRNLSDGSGADIYDDEVSAYRTQTALYLALGQDLGGWAPRAYDRENFVSGGAARSHENVCGTRQQPTGACYAPFR